MTFPDESFLIHSGEVTTTVQLMLLLAGSLGEKKGYDYLDYLEKYEVRRCTAVCNIYGK